VLGRAMASNVSALASVEGGRFRFFIPRCERPYAWTAANLRIGICHSRQAS